MDSEHGDPTWAWSGSPKPGEDPWVWRLVCWEVKGAVYLCWSQLISRPLGTGRLAEVEEAGEAGLLREAAEASCHGQREGTEALDSGTGQISSVGRQRVCNPGLERGHSNNSKSVYVSQGIENPGVTKTKTSLPSWARQWGTHKTVTQIILK